MKILLINNAKGWSGGQEHLKDLAMELRTRGVEVHFTARAGTPSETRFRQAGFPVYPIPYRHGINDLKALAGLVSLMRRERFDVVSINREHDLFMTALAWRLAVPFRPTGKLMMSYHLPTERKQLLLGAADAIACISEHVKTKLLRGNPAAAARTHILYYGIVLSGPPSTSRFAIDRPRRFFTGRGFPIIGMVGEFWKNADGFFTLVCQVGAICLFLGAEPDRLLGSSAVWRDVSVPITVLRVESPPDVNGVDPEVVEHFI